MKTNTVAAAAIAALGLVGLGAGAAQAQDFQPKAKGGIVLDVRVTQVSPEGDDPVTGLDGAATGLKAHVSDDVMPTLGLQYFLTDNIAVEAILGTTKHSVRGQGAGLDIPVKDTWVLPPVVALQYHFAPKARVSPYVGAGINYMVFYKGKNLNGFDFDVDNGFGAALQAGVDVALKGRWTLNADLKKVFFETDAVDHDNEVKTKVTLDPLVASLGVGYRF